MALFIATTILNPATNFVSWLDYHLPRSVLIIIYLDDPTKRPQMERLCRDRAVKLCDGAMEAPGMAPANRTLLRQSSNLKHAIAFLLDQQHDGQQPTQQGQQDPMKEQHRQGPLSGKGGAGDWWLLHIDQDEILYENGDTSWQTMPDVGHVTFTNHEAIPIPHDTLDAFTDCHWFNVNSDEPFMAYGNGKSAVRLTQGVLPNGAHCFKGYEGLAITQPALIPSLPGDQAKQNSDQRHPVILHYPYPSFEAWAAKFELYGNFSDYWLDDKKYPNMLEFMLRSRDKVQAALASGNWTEAREFFGARVLDDERIRRGVQAGMVRYYDPESAASTSFEAASSSR